MERSTAYTKKEVLSSYFVESSRPSLTTVRLEVPLVRLNIINSKHSKVKILNYTMDQNNGKIII